MKKSFLRVAPIPLLLILFAFTLFQQKQITVYMIGDSTMAEKKVEAYPETGWGMPFSRFFDSSVVVKNLAMNGRSTKTFLSEGRWAPVTAGLREGNYVIIQFGHNDEVKTKASYTTPEEFVTNLTKYVNETRLKKGIPILLTPVARRRFDSATGQLVGTHDEYSALVRVTAQTYHVPLIDHDKLSQDYLRQLGPDKSKFLYNWLEPDEHPNYPKGVSDDTHFNELGARKMAEIVLKALKTQNIDLAAHIRRK